MTNTISARAIFTPFRIILGLSIPLLLMACYPARETFFEPSADSGRVVKQACHQAVGPGNRIVFDREKVEITAGTYFPEEGGQKLKVAIAIDIPNDVYLSFRSKEFIVSNESREYYLQPDRVEGFYYNYPPSRGKQIPGWQTLYGGTYDFYYLSIYLPFNEVNAFSLLFPPLLINEKEVNLPRITFSIKSEWFINPINC